MSDQQTTAAELAPELQAKAAKLAQTVLGKVKGHDDQALSQAKYIAFHKANSAGMRLDEATFRAFLDLVRRTVESELEKRRPSDEAAPVIQTTPKDYQ